MSWAGLWTQTQWGDFVDSGRQNSRQMEDELNWRNSDQKISNYVWEASEASLLRMGGCVMLNGAERSRKVRRKCTTVRVTLSNTATLYTLPKTCPSWHSLWARTQERKYVQRELFLNMNHRFLYPYRLQICVWIADVAIALLYDRLSEFEGPVVNKWLVNMFTLPIGNRNASVFTQYVIRRLPVIVL